MLQFIKRSSNKSLGWGSMFHFYGVFALEAWTNVLLYMSVGNHHFWIAVTVNSKMSITTGRKLLFDTLWLQVRWLVVVHANDSNAFSGVLFLTERSKRRSKLSLETSNEICLDDFHCQRSIPVSPASLVGVQLFHLPARQAMVYRVHCLVESQIHAPLLRAGSFIYFHISPTAPACFRTTRTSMGCVVSD